MKAFLGVWAALAAFAVAPVLAHHPVATVNGEVLSHEGPDSAGAEPDEVARLAQAMQARIFRDFVEQHGLTATPEEITALAEYNAEFRRRDRAQRARKLTELEQRLGADGLAPEERAHLEEFRATLARLAAYEAEQDRKPPADATERQASFGPWIEMWKLNRAIYERFGGTVALAPFGHYPHGAWVALVADYEVRGALRFHDAALRERVLAFFSRPPQIVVAPHLVDFTPYWRRPIPPSYFPDAASPSVEKREAEGVRQEP